MWSIPKKVSLVSGDAEGSTELNAFDNALTQAGIGDLNLVKVTSIIPPGAHLVELPRIAPGTLMPVVYTFLGSSEPGCVISCALGAGFPEDRESIGFIAEVNMVASAQKAESTVKKMVKEGMGKRGIPIRNIVCVSAEHTVERIGCVVCAAVLL
ncbi:MAG: arginine decarboxylase, pyruvoyl-dependent [Candidatus Methanofastidiosia archaeon]|jgi:arginine decarboxylase